jgi:hypothetical protein
MEVAILSDYEDFIATKLKTVRPSGFNPNKLNANLFPFQEWVVRRALNHGKYAVFGDCGLGKSLMQLVCARGVSDYTNGKTLILAPLAVVDQTKDEALKFGVLLDNIDITNYEQLDNIDPLEYQCLVLDESSILKNFEGATKKKLIDSFKDTPYKFCFTATPSPNDPTELGNHSEILDVMPRTEMLAMFFVHDAGKQREG